MQRLATITGNIILFLLFLLLFLLVFESRVQLPVWLQVAGRFHPLVLHIPIGSVVLFVVLLLFRNFFKKKSFRQMVLLCLLFVALSASFSALLGFFLSVNGDYGTDALARHKAGGIIFSLLSYALLLWFRYGNKNFRIFYGIGFITLLSLVIAGHTGSVLTHGENYILAPWLQVSSKKDPQTTSVYQLVVMPVLEKKCFSCHNESKAKGKLIMTSVEKFKRGGKNGNVWVEGEPDSSRMVQYIRLPLEHDHHMPPDGKPQLSPIEVSLLEAWIRSGADFEKKIHEYRETDTLVALAETILNAAAHDLRVTAYDFKPAPIDMVEKLNTPFRTVSPLHQNSPALQVDFFVRESFQSGSLGELKVIKDQLVILNLSKMPLTDDDLKAVSEFKNLETLNLNFTSISGDGLKHLTSLGKLKSLALSGTSVTRENLAPLLSNPSLKQVFIWNTKISESEKAELENDYPGVRFIHNLFTGSETLVLSKPQLVNEEMVRKGELLQLRHVMPGVTVRYSLDGSVPDSVSGLVYEGPVAVNETVKLKALACRPGWYCSKLLEAAVYVEGIKPERAVLLAQADKKYPGDGAATLTDGRKGYPDIFKNPAWLGYRDNVFEAGFEFGPSPPSLNKVVLSYGENLGAYIFPPVEVEVWGGKNEKEVTLLRSVKTILPTDYRPERMEAMEIVFGPSTHSFYKVIARPVNKLPKWHNGKGQKGWFFIDELFFY